MEPVDAILAIMRASDVFSKEDRYNIMKALCASKLMQENMQSVFNLPEWKEYCETHDMEFMHLGFIENKQSALQQARLKQQMKEISRALVREFDKDFPGVEVLGVRQLDDHLVEVKIKANQTVPYLLKDGKAILGGRKPVTGVTEAQPQNGM